MIDVSVLLACSSVEEFLTLILPFGKQLDYKPGQVMISDWYISKIVDVDGLSDAQRAKKIQSVRNVFNHFTSLMLINEAKGIDTVIDGYEVILTSRTKDGKECGFNFHYFPNNSDVVA